MDRVRFGRALGYGARHAAKSLRAAAEAAAAPDATKPAQPVVTPNQARGAGVREPSTGTANRAAVRSVQTASHVAAAQIDQVLRGAAQVHAVHHRVKREAGKQARRSFLGPLAKFSSVVSLQVTGTFFALIAVLMAQAVWRSRDAFHSGGGDARRLYIVTGVGLLFAYFAVSNFVRARRRDRRS